MAGIWSPNQSSNWSFSSSPFSGVGDDEPDPMTLLQLLQLQHAKSRKPKRSFVQSLRHGVGLAADPVLWAFDKIERPLYGIANAYDKGFVPNSTGKGNHLDIGEALHGAREGVMGREKTNFGDFLKHRNVFANHKFARGASGFLADVALDPTTYLTFGGAAAAHVGTEGAFKAGEAVLRDTGSAFSKKEASEALKTIKAHTEALKGAGPNFAQRAQLAHVKAQVLRKASFGTPISNADRQALSLARSTARAERDVVSKKLLTIGTRQARVSTPLRLPHMESIGASRIPVLSQLVEGVGKSIVPGYGDRVTHAALISRKHQGEELATQYLEVARKRFEHVSHLSDKTQRAALHFFEKPGGVIEQNGKRVLNPERVAEAKAAGISDEGIEFAHAMNDVSEHLHAQHVQHGLDVENIGHTKGQLYVPHIVMSDGSPLVDRYRNMLTQRGFTKDRRGEYSVAQLHAMKQAGTLPKGVETSPFRLLTHHVRAVANQHADSALLKHAVDAVGVRTKIVDGAKLSATEKALAEAMKKTEGHPGAEEGRLERLHEESKLGHEDAALMRHREDVAHREALIKHHMDADWEQHTMATVTRLSKRNAASREKLMEDLKSIREGTHPDVQKDIEGITKQHEAHVAEHAALQSEVEKLHKELAKHAGGTANPAAHGDMVTIDALKDEHGHPYALPREVAEPIKRLQRVVDGDDEAIKAFAKTYGVWLGKWKVGVTSVNPGYGVRNTLSDAWNMWLSGVPLYAMATYGGKAAHLMRQAKTGDPKATSTILDAYHQGVLSGLFQGDIQEIEYMLKSAGSKRALAKNKRFLALYVKVTQDINRNRENWGRLTHYMYRREHDGMGIADAAAKVKEAHFDYEDLTPFEQKVMKRVAPFYTWSRKNIPFQVKMAVAAPGRMAAFPKLAQEVEGDSGKGEIVPDFMRKGLYIRLPGGKMLNPAIGVADLEKLNPHNAKDTAISMASPFFKVPAELLTNKNMLTGQEIVSKDGHPRNPVNDKLAGLLSMLPGSNVGPTERGGVRGAGIDPRWSYLFSQLPATNTFVNQSGKIKGSQRGSFAKEIAYLTGINASENPQEVQKVIANLEERDDFKKYLRGLRDEGLVPETKKRKKSRNQQTLEDALVKSLSGGR